MLLVIKYILSFQIYKFYFYMFFIVFIWYLPNEFAHNKANVEEDIEISI